MMWSDGQPWLLPLAALLGALVPLAGGCSCNGGGTGGPLDGSSASSDTGQRPDRGAVALDGLVSLDVAPADAVLTIVDDQPAAQVYTVTGTFDDGRSEDITGAATLAVENITLGTFEEATFTTGTEQGGSTRVLARAAGLSTHTLVTVRLEKERRDPAATDLPDAPGDAFETAGDDAARTPTIVYPNDGVLLPPNLNDLEVHFLPGDGNELFEVAFESELADVRVYTRCTEPLEGGCIYALDPDVWRWVAHTHRGTSVTVQVRGTDDGGSGRGTAEPIEVRFSQDDIRGGIYYWTTPGDGTDSAVMRYDFGSREQVEPERIVGTEMTDGHCLGCHALSRDGTKMLVAANGSYDAFVLLLDVASQTPRVPFDSTPRSAFSSWNPDGTAYVGVFADERDEGFLSYDLNVFDGETGAHVETIDVGGTESQPADHPDWSPAGDRIAFTRVGQANEESGTLAYVARSSLEMVVRDGEGWTAPVQLTSPVEGESTHYPTFSPDGSLLAYNRSTCADGSDGDDCDAYDDPTAMLWVMVPEPGDRRIELGRANAPGVMDEVELVQSSFPKWAPFTFQRNQEFNSRLQWITFSSNRRYGLRSPANPGDTLIWMAGVDPDHAVGGDDPSHPAFALPFQDLERDNHTAQWTEEVVPLE